MIIFFKQNLNWVLLNSKTIIANFKLIIVNLKLQDFILIIIIFKVL